MDMHSLATLDSHNCVNYRWNMEIAGQNVLIWRGSIKRLDLQTTYRYMAKHFSIYSYWRGLPHFVVTRSENMRVSHSGTSNVKILEFFKHFRPASEPCKLRTIGVRDSIFSLPALHTRTYPPYNSQSMDMHSSATLVFQIWVNYRWNMEIAGQNVLIWRGSIKRLDLQTTYRYRAKHFRIYSYWRGLPCFVVTRSENMRVSHSGTSNLNILEIFKHFWPASEPCKQRTIGVRDSIFSVPALHTRIYPPYNSQSMGIHSLSTLVFQNCVNYRWNMEIALQNVLFWMGSIKRLDLQTTYRYRAKHFRIYSYWSGLSYFVVTRSENMRVSHSGTSNVKILEIFKHFWPASEPCK